MAVARRRYRVIKRKHAPKAPKAFNEVVSCLSNCAESQLPICTKVNKTDPNVDDGKAMKSPGGASKHSPPPFCRLRPSNANEIVKLFEKPENYLPHSLTAKIRPHDSGKHEMFDDLKEN
jgi:hypothetical protein